MCKQQKYFDILSFVDRRNYKAYNLVSKTKTLRVKTFIIKTKFKYES